MSRYRKKPVEIEAITFDEFVEYGRAQPDVYIRNGMPWSFKYKGWPITQENDRCYLIPTLEGTHNFTPEDMLITGVAGEIYPCKIDIFNKTYDEIGRLRGMQLQAYGDYEAFDHEPSEDERKAAAHELAVKLLPFLEKDGVICQQDRIDKSRWTVAVTAYLPGRAAQGGAE